MKYCFNYDLKMPNEINEFIVDYNKSNITIVDFVKTFKENQRIILDVSYNNENNFIRDNLGIFGKCYKEHKNFAIRIGIHQLVNCIDLYELNIPYFIFYLCDSWDNLTFLANKKVTDIYITNELGFCLQRVRATVGQDIQIRIIPNIAQTSCISNGTIEDIYKFFIRPEDVKYYETYVDVLEFLVEPSKAELIYKIYSRGEWKGNLNEIIYGFNKSVQNSLIHPLFGERRCCCEKRCFKGINCNLCQNAIDLSETLYKNNIQFEQVVIDEEKD